MSTVVMKNNSEELILFPSTNLGKLSLDKT